MKSQDTNKTSEQLQKEVHGQIDKIGRNIDYAKSRMSPGAILDDAIFYPHGQSLSDTYTHLKNNPMGTMFLSLGTLLLMEDQQHVTYERRLRGQGGAAVDKGKVRYEHGKENISHKASELADKAKLKAQEAKHKIERKGEELKHKASAKKDELGQRASTKRSEFESQASSYGSELSSEKHRARDKARELKEKGSQKFSEMKQKGSQRIENAKASMRNARENFHPEEVVGNLHPFAIASVGLGLGATIGASFPETSREKGLRDEKFQKQLQRLSNDVDHAVRESGNRIKNHLIDELKQFNFH
ncbi:MAG: hypothetical protein CME64_12245 [Halobacteriovoraceae bacterium]|nr:hypothetical protein [Halobacteriovoraceae bacterium]